MQLLPRASTTTDAREFLISGTDSSEKSDGPHTWGEKELHVGLLLRKFASLLLNLSLLIANIVRPTRLWMLHSLTQDPL